jgi:predicted ATP-grasp superfamily ATP-dependent carboligase
MKSIPNHQKPYLSKPVIIITQCHLRFGYNVFKSLVAQGYRVIAGSEKGYPSQVSKKENPEKIFYYSSPFLSPERFIGDLKKQAALYGTVILLPIHEDIFVIAKYRDYFDCATTSVLCPSLQVLLSLHDKFAVYKSCVQLKISCPQTWLITSVDDVKEVVQDQTLTNEWILKPRYGEGGKFMYVIKNHSDFLNRFNIIRGQITKREYILQVKVSGKGIGIGCLRVQDRVVAISGHLRLREVPISGGTSCARVTFFNDSIFKDTIDLLANFGLNGICMVEYRFNFQTGEYFLLDVNPRYWGGLSLHLSAGVDYPKLQIAYFLEDKNLPVDTIKTMKMVESRWALGEIRALGEYIAARDWLEVKNILTMPTDHGVVYEGNSSIKGFFYEVFSYIRREISTFLSSRCARTIFFKEQGDK